MTSASPTDVVSYVPYTQNVTVARRRVAHVVCGWGHPGLAGDAALIAGELAANALLHGCLRDRLFRVEVNLLEKALRIAVTDPRGERHPQPRHALDDEQFGRGLTIVAALASRWGVEPLTVGKTVWAEVDLAPQCAAPGSIGHSAR
ncbi:ATP-binding protein [Streptomyces sp. H27-C3]|uniref:ATP-binding protein n=1 Tax=Streptomyces sp. H27-C3 TaxID=3046305 RepID=UPI0024B9F4C7|nr:ATP-binding protein [Streptomyces sp. H27-C3]MDJ0461965.1 ATP-binding protein [Streptomyces sp. H27-C3]